VTDSTPPRRPRTVHVRSTGAPARPPDSPQQPDAGAVDNPQSDSARTLGPGTPHRDSDDFQRTAELEFREVREGSRPGTRYVRIVRPASGTLRRVEHGHLIATERAIRGRTWAGRLWGAGKRILIGQPLTNADLPHERLSKLKALAVFASDAVSSSAYATEEILLVLALAGAAALSYAVPVSVAIVALLAIVAMSYRQTIGAYPLGGGSYIVTKDNLGTTPSLVAASSLLVGYVLTVAVSVSAGVAALTSAVPALHGQKVALAVAFILLITIGNLRGVRESGSIFMAPTYMFIGGFLLMIVVGMFRVVAGLPPVEDVAGTVTEMSESLTVFLVLRAFTSGCAALTGTEAISDGVPAFKPPEAQNARRTLTSMAIILGILFFGISVLAVTYQIAPREGETVVSQVARAVFGIGPLYYYVQFATMLGLVLAANTSFADFPRLSYFLARDSFLPRQFRFRGDRLSFSSGIAALALLSIALVVGFNAETHALIPMYALGVFISFTSSQASMVRRWWRLRGAGWIRGAIINGVGAVTTATVALIFTATKFTEGAWMVVVVLPASVLLLLAINRHYSTVSDHLSLDLRTQPLPRHPRPLCIVPIDELNLGSLHALSYATSISDEVVAVLVTDDMELAEASRRKWERWGGEIPLVILESPYRTLTGPFLSYLDAIQSQRSGTPITVVLPEFVPRHWWEFALHNQAALRLKASLFFRPDTVVVDVPYHLAR
jgi:amino acid transporter